MTDAAKDSRLYSNNTDWTEEDIARVANVLEQEFRHLGRSNIDAATWLCAHCVPQDAGIETLVTHTRSFLQRIGPDERK